MANNVIKNILITGVSTGIGLDTALSLTENGYTVYGTVRKKADAEKIQDASGGKVIPILMDVTDDQSVKEGFQTLSQHTDELYALINNAGIVIGGPIECLPIDRLKEQMEVNVFGVIRVTQQAIPMLRQYSSKHHNARIINISSIAGLSPLPFVSPYSASKHALESISDALRVELSPWGIDVSLIEPGAVKTPIWEKSLTNAKAITGEMDPEKIKLYERALDRVATLSQQSDKRAIPTSVVVNAITHALGNKRPKTRYLLGLDAKLRKFSRKLPDRLQDWVIKKKLGV